MASKPKIQDGGEYIVRSFYGLKTMVKNPKDLLPGQPQDSLNWLTGYNTYGKYGDNIQLRSGSALLCKTRLGAGKINAFAVGQDATGKQWPFFAAGGKFYYYSAATQDLALVANGTLAATEDMTLEFYQDLFGPYMYSGSPNTGINLVSVANKTMSPNLSNLQAITNGATSITGGYFTLRQNFGWMWNWLNPLTKILDINDLNQSKPDQVSVADASISNPQGSTGVSGNGVLQTFSGTLNGFANLAFAPQIGAPINSFPITSVVITGGGIGGGLDFQVNFTGGDVFSDGDYLVLQGMSNPVTDAIGGRIVNDFMAIVTAHQAGEVFLSFILPPASLTNTTGCVATYAINTAGSGYVVGDLVVIGIGLTLNAVFQVTSVDGGGGITGINMISSGIGASAGNPYTVSGGTGTGGKITPTSVGNNQVVQSMTVSKLELFEDDKNGGLVSLLNSNDTGTINYSSGAFTINTQTPVPNGLNIDSIVFTGVPGVITFAPGFWQQFGGILEAVKFFNNQLFEFHNINTWLINLGFASASATTGTNGQEQYRQNLGIPYFRAAFETGEGILFLDTTQQNNYRLRQLEIVDLNTEPVDLSLDIDLSQFSPNTCFVGNVGNYNFLSLQSLVNGVAKGYNDTTFLRNNISGFFDKLDYRIGVMDTYNGTVIAGDTLSQNLYQLFTGQDDDGAPINNYWTSGQDDFGMDGLKRFGFFHIDGLIGPSQVLNIYVQFDTGNYVLIGSVYGNGRYVDKNNSILIGLGLGGANPSGGAGNGQLTGYHFEQDIPIWTPLFQYISIKFIAGVNLSGRTPQPAFGALQINEYGFKDLRIKSVKALAQNIGR